MKFRTKYDALILLTSKSSPILIWIRRLDGKSFQLESTHNIFSIKTIFFCKFSMTLLRFRTMVNVERGMLLTVDKPIKQFIIHLDEYKSFRGRKFILKGLILLFIYI